jgi:hypothetical protein
MKRRTVTMIVFGGGLTIAVAAVMLLALPQKARAAKGCTLNDARGTYGFQFSGFSPDMAGQPTFPFAETGRWVVDAAGNITGESRYSYGGMIFTHTFAGTLTVYPDCTAVSNVVDDPNGFHLESFWVIVKPREEVLLTSLTPGGVANGRAERMRGSLE